MFNKLNRSYIESLPAEKILLHFFGFALLNLALFLSLTFSPLNLLREGCNHLLGLIVTYNFFLLLSEIGFFFLYLLLGALNPTPLVAYAT